MMSAQCMRSSDVGGLGTAAGLSRLMAGGSGIHKGRSTVVRTAITVHERSTVVERSGICLTCLC